MKQVNLYADGSCTNQGQETSVGGWNAILQYNDHDKMINGYESHTTGQKMVLRAIIEGIKILREPCEIKILTNSDYVCTTASKMRQYISNGWKNTAGKEIANKELWEELISVGNGSTLPETKAGKHKIIFQHTDGKDAYSKCCDILAKNKVQLAMK